MEKTIKMVKKIISAGIVDRKVDVQQETPWQMEKTIKMVKNIISISWNCGQANANSVASTDPLPLLSLRIKPNQQASQSCLYTVVITTSCSSSSYTRDLISLSFGDAYGNQVYVPRLEDPATRTFERCSADAFQVQGPCTRQVCYMYLYMRGYDGWKPGTVQIYDQYYTGADTTPSYRLMYGGGIIIAQLVFLPRLFCDREVSVV